MIDDAHGTGVMGARGRGIAEHSGVLGEVDILTGTLGKALGGAAGGYVASSAAVCDMLAQRSRPQLFSNGLAPTVACSSLRAIEVLDENPSLVERLRAHTRSFRQRITLTILYPTQDARDDALQTGMKRGIAASYNRLAEYLKTQQ